MMSMQPKVVWFTGIPASGKTTMARLVSAVLTSAAVPNMVLDGDELRATVSADLGFSDEDRIEQARRTAQLATVHMAQKDRVVLVALVSPLRAAREAARDIIGAERFVEVYCWCSPEQAAKRDPKGLYARAAAGEIRGLTGHDAVYEEPETPAVTIPTHVGTRGECLDLALKAIGADA